MSTDPESFGSDRKIDEVFRGITDRLDDLRDTEPKFVSANNDVATIRDVYKALFGAIDLKSIDSLAAFLDLATQFHQSLERTLSERSLGLSVGDYVMVGGNIPYYTEEDSVPLPLDINLGSVIVGTVKAIEPGMMPLEDYRRYHLSDEG